jgi:pyruvate-ferredoxin/flavodoxin oxidoreductase
MKNYKVMDGNEACSYIAYMFTEIAGIYPITPSSPMAEHIDEWSKKGRKNIFGDEVKVVEMQSEAGAAGMIHGSLQAGALATTFTSSQGLLLMIPNMYKMAGELLPGVIHVAARSLSTHALSIMCDHADVYAVRDTGFAILASSGVQQVMDLAGIAHLSSIKSRVPFLHFFDGFRTSHEVQKIEVLSEDIFKDLIDMEKIKEFRNRSLVSSKVTRGTSQGDDIYFQATEIRNKYYNDVVDIIVSYMNEISKRVGREYKPFNYYGHVEAEKIIVAMGSVCETIKETVDYLNNHGEKVGLIEVHLYRPFSLKYFFEVLPNTVKKIAVLDRSKDFGSKEPLYSDVIDLFNNKENKPYIIGGRYGLSSKDTTPNQIKAVYDFLDKEDSFDNFTIGINDDVTNLSLNVDNNFTINNNQLEMLIYGYGSDGTVSASRNLLKIIGDNTNYFVQGYFQYDSKKSGGITRTHLRISNKEIRSTYYVNKPILMVCNQLPYLERFDILKNIREGGLFLINTDKSNEEIYNLLKDEVKYQLASKKVRFLVVNANELARKLGLGGKINTIIQSIIFRIINIIDYSKAKDLMKESVQASYYKRGDKVIEANIKAIDEAENYVREIDIDPNWINLNVSKEEIKENSFIDKVIMPMNTLSGDDIPVSAFKNVPDGTFPISTTELEKRGISDFVPSWIPENCIDCAQCSFVCPHAVIRPFLLNEEELGNAPDAVKDKLKDPIGKDMEGLKYRISVSVLDCTGCNLCVSTCPGRNGEKALIMKPLRDEAKEQEASSYLFSHVTDKKLINPYTIKGSQFRKPLFEFHGACAGCGETSYIKLLTQLYGENMIIANATGCSSIYGGSAPSMPYGVSWANSLFEDNAEYGFGMLMGIKTIKERIKRIMLDNLDKVDSETKELFNSWLNNMNDYNLTKEVSERLKNIPLELEELKVYIPKKSVWCIGGDGWAYDIDFGGLDHVLSSYENVNILVLDSQVYSNTGGQTSKASPSGMVAKFASDGKETAKKDLAKMIMNYPHVYVAQISLGSNMQQAINAFKEAEAYDGPSIIIAYSPCIAHGIKEGMSNSMIQEKKAVECGYWPIFRYNPVTKEFSLDCKPNFDLYEEFLESETRYSLLKNINPEKFQELLSKNKQEAINRWNYYNSLKKEDS